MWYTVFLPGFTPSPLQIKIKCYVQEINEMFTPSVQDLLHLMSHLAPTGSQHRPKEEEDLSGGLGHKP